MPILRASHSGKAMPRHVRQLVSATLKVTKTKDLMNKEVLSVFDGKQNVRAAWSTSENGLDELTKKYVGGKVSKKFVNENGSLRKYRGEVTHVHFIRSNAQYVMHVSYLSDSDSEDMEEHEIKDCWVGYENC